MWHRLYYHLVWTTEERALLLDKECMEFICRYARHAAGEHRSNILELGGVRSHVHLLFVAHPMTELSKLIGHIKGGCSTLWNKEYAPTSGWKLTWAPGYGLSTVSRRQLPGVRDHLRAQPRHHPTEVIAGWLGDRAWFESMRGEEGQ